MIFARRRFVPDSEEAIGKELGLVVPSEVADEFADVRVGRPHAHGYGTAIDDPRYSLNRYFEQHKIGLRTVSFLPTDARAVRTMLRDFLAADADIIACIDAGTFYGIDVHVGHLVLVEHVQKLARRPWTAIIVDPNSHLRRVVSLEFLARAMNVKRSGWEGGLYIIAEPEVLGLPPLV